MKKHAIFAHLMFIMIIIHLNSILITNEWHLIPYNTEDYRTDSIWGHTSVVQTVTTFITFLIIQTLPDHARAKNSFTKLVTLKCYCNPHTESKAEKWQYFSTAVFANDVSVLFVSPRPVVGHGIKLHKNIHKIYPTIFIGHIVPINVTKGQSKENYTTTCRSNCFGQQVSQEKKKITSALQCDLPLT